MPYALFHASNVPKSEKTCFFTGVVAFCVIPPILPTKGTVKAATQQKHDPNSLPEPVKLWGSSPISWGHSTDVNHNLANKNTQHSFGSESTQDFSRSRSQEI